MLASKAGAFLHDFFHKKMSRHEVMPYQYTLRVLAQPAEKHAGTIHHIVGKLLCAGYVGGRMESDVTTRGSRPLISGH